MAPQEGFLIVTEPLNQYQDDFELEEMDEFDAMAANDDSFIPTCDHSSLNLENNLGAITYSTRGPSDVVLSGPVVGGWGPGRYFRSRRLAFAAMREKYGPERVIPTRQNKGRWSFLIKNLRAA